MIFQCIASIFVIVGIYLLLGLTPEKVTEDLLNIMTPKDSLREEVRNLRGNKKRHKLYTAVMNFKNALSATGKGKQFSLVCFLSLVLMAGGVILSLFINNIFLMPVFAVAGALVPFFYTANTISYYEKQTREELETALSIITNSYIRTDDIILAVEENKEYIKPPLNNVFGTFAVEAKTVSSNIKKALYNLKENLDNDIFKEWCDALIQCQDDRTLKDTLLPIVSKLTDVRVVNNEVKTLLSSARMEYLMMALLVVGNIPLLYFLNKDWFHALVFNTSGKVVLGICGAVILVTSLFMLKFTKPIEYKR